MIFASKILNALAAVVVLRMDSAMATPFQDVAVDPTAAQLPLGECAGDCDNDNECDVGLYCYMDTGLGVPTTCTGTPRTNWDYCGFPQNAACGELNPIAVTPIHDTPLEKCEGDCDNDSDCQPGLFCYHNPSTVPGCQGTVDAVPAMIGYDFCGCPPTGCPAEHCCPGETGCNLDPGAFQDIAVDPSPAQLPLLECQGDCDSDAECAPGFYCYMDTEALGVPDCRGTPTPGYDYCGRNVAPCGVLNAIRADPDMDYPLNKCEADCDIDDHCKGELVCHMNPTAVEGCTGTLVPQYDYCGCPVGGCTSDEHDCPDTGMDGDPHLTSWSGEFFDYMGECDLVLVHAPKIDMDIHARTTIRYGYSFIESAALRIGSDILELSSWGGYAWNGVEEAGLLQSENTWLRKGQTESTEIKMGGYPVYYTELNKRRHKFEVVLGPHANVTIGNMKSIVSVKVNHGDGSFFSGVEGILGHFNGKMLARDGVTSLHDDINAMGQEWQVRDDEEMLFRTARSPQYPDQCRLPDTAEKEGRRLGAGISEETAKLACNHLKGNEHAFVNCIYDVTAMNDLEMAEGGAF